MLAHWTGERSLPFGLLVTEGLTEIHNSPTDSVDLASGDRHWLSEPTTWLRITGKKISFQTIGRIMMPKRIGYKLSMIFSLYMCKRQGGPKLVHLIS